MTVVSDTSIATASVSAEAVPPAPGAEDQKPAAPASEADVQNPEAAAETPEQVAAKQESRRARSNARKAAALAEARAEAKILRERLDKLESQQRPQQQDAEPKKREGQSDDDYLREVIDWRADQRAEAKLKADREAREGKEKQSQAARGQEEVSRGWNEREKAFQATAKDYTDVVTPYLDSEEFGAMHQMAKMAIVESEKGPAVLHYLATHSDDAERIADLSPTRQVQELGKLEEKLVTAKKPSNAPDPVKPLGQGRSGTKDPSKMSDAEYREFRKATGARWAQ